MRMSRARAALIAAAIVVLPSLSLAVPLVSPAAGSDVILSMRGTPTGELRFEYRQEGNPDGPSSVTGGLAGDYHYLQGPERLRIYDYHLRRIFRVQHADTFINDSLYADVWYRAAELHNRVTMSGAFQGAGVSVPKAVTIAHDPFWIASDLGMVSPQIPHPDLKQVTAKGRTRWLLKDEEVAAVRYDSKEIPRALQGGLLRFWITFTPMHPDIAAALAASKHLPAELWIKQQRFGKDPVVVHWTLRAQKWEATASYPLPAHLAAHPAVVAGAYPDIFATLTAATTDKRLPPTQETYTTRAEAALQNGAGLEALLWAIEMSLAQGTAVKCAPNDTQPQCALLARIGPVAKNDPRTALAFNNQSPDESDRPQFDNLPNAYMLRLLWATRPSGKGVEPAERERDLLAALRASAVANFCKDTGDFYAMGWQPYLAWQVWDLGRLMAGHRSGDLLAQVDANEINMVTSEPDYF